MKDILKSLLYEYWYYPVILVLILMLCSCGTRKTNKEYHEFKSNYSFSDSSYTLTQNVRLNDIGELVPIDNSKPFFVDGKEYFNVSIKFDKSKFEGFELEKKNIGTSNGHSEILETKQTEKSDYTMLWVLIAFIICSFIFLWFYLPKLKV